MLARASTHEGRGGGVAGVAGGAGRRWAAGRRKEAGCPWFSFSEACGACGLDLEFRDWSFGLRVEDSGFGALSLR